MSDSSHHITGHIVAFQEERFRLKSDAGQTFLFTLANHAPVDLSDLAQWHAERTHVRVEYSGEPNIVSGIARAVSAV